MGSVARITWYIFIVAGRILMTRMTPSISLALLGSSLILAGCFQLPPRTPEEEEKQRAHAVAPGGHAGSYIHPTYVRGNQVPSTGGSPSTGIHSPSHSGGFGSRGAPRGGAQTGPPPGGRGNTRERS